MGLPLLFGLRGGVGGPAASGGGFLKVCGGCHGRRSRIFGLTFAAAAAAGHVEEDLLAVVSQTFS